MIVRDDSPGIEIAGIGAARHVWYSVVATGRSFIRFVSGSNVAVPLIQITGHPFAEKVDHEWVIDNVDCNTVRSQQLLVATEIDRIRNHHAGNFELMIVPAHIMQGLRRGTASSRASGRTGRHWSGNRSRHAG